MKEENVMRRKFLSIFTVAAISVSLITGCGNSSESVQSQEDNTEVSEAAEDSATETSQEEAEDSATETSQEEAKDAASETSQEEAKDAASEATQEESSEEVASSDDAETGASEDMVISDGEIRVGALKGPTTMGLVNLMSEAEEGTSEGTYTFTMEAQPADIMASMVSGQLDIALVPANMASVMNNKVEGGVSVIDINTLGVLYCVTGDDTITSVKDLSGKTVLSTGQGATPEYALNYLLEKNEVTDCNVEFKSEATEIAALLSEDSSQIAILPQPFVTVAEAQNEALSTAFSLTDEWAAVSDDSQLLTGVTVVSNSFLEENEDLVDMFIEEHQESVSKATEDIEATAELVAKYGIIEKAPVAVKALPYCNIVCITGDEMKTSLSGYLNVLYEQDPASVGGSVPEDSFYYIAQ
ncbi:MAG: ABC transporter substrate-binding protein [Butyrivibrio sp.]|nr:ABC transporter substrate-binding protein [Butyrivibrio sp.]